MYDNVTRSSSVERVFSKAFTGSAAPAQTSGLSHPLRPLLERAEGLLAAGNVGRARNHVSTDNRKDGNDQLLPVRTRLVLGAEFELAVLRPFHARIEIRDQEPAGGVPFAVNLVARYDQRRDHGRRQCLVAAEQPVPV